MLQLRPLAPRVGRAGSRSAGRLGQHTMHHIMVTNVLQARALYRFDLLARASSCMLCTTFCVTPRKIEGTTASTARTLCDSAENKDTFGARFKCLIAARRWQAFPAPLIFMVAVAVWGASPVTELSRDVWPHNFSEAESEMCCSGVFAGFMLCKPVPSASLRDSRWGKCAERLGEASHPDPPSVSKDEEEPRTPGQRSQRTVSVWHSLNVFVPGGVAPTAAEAETFQSDLIRRSSSMADEADARFVNIGSVFRGTRDSVSSNTLHACVICREVVDSMVEGREAFESTFCCGKRLHRGCVRDLQDRIIPNCRCRKWLLSVYDIRHGY